jgi:hypothetical protein
MTSKRSVNILSLTFILKFLKKFKVLLFSIYIQPGAYEASKDWGGGAPASRSTLGY